MAAGQTRKTGVSVCIAVRVSVSGFRAFSALSFPCCRLFGKFLVRLAYRFALPTETAGAYSASIQTPPTRAMEPSGT